MGTIDLKNIITRWYLSRFDYWSN